MPSFFDVVSDWSGAACGAGNTLRGPRSKRRVSEEMINSSLLVIGSVLRQLDIFLAGIPCG
jgi:hypothetical protein